MTHDEISKEVDELVDRLRELTREVPDEADRLRAHKALTSYSWHVMVGLGRVDLSRPAVEWEA